MSKNDRRGSLKVPDDRDTGTILAWFQELIQQGRLAWRLLLDGRVPLWAKGILPIVLAYLISPVDILPDVALGLGQLDDIAVLMLGMKLFIEVSPPEIVRQHLKALGAQIKEWRVVDEDEASSQDVIEGQYSLRESSERASEGQADEDDES